MSPIIFNFPQGEALSFNSPQYGRDWTDEDLRAGSQPNPQATITARLIGDAAQLHDSYLAYTGRTLRLSWTGWMDEYWTDEAEDWLRHKAGSLIDEPATIFINNMAVAEIEAGVVVEQ